MKLIPLVLLYLITATSCKKSKPVITTPDTDTTATPPPTDTTTGQDTTVKGGSTVVVSYTGIAAHSEWQGNTKLVDTSFPGFGTVIWKYSDSSVTINCSISSDKFKIKNQNSYGVSDRYSGISYVITDTTLSVVRHSSNPLNSTYYSFKGKRD